MATFFMFGKYSSEAIKKISAARTKSAQNLIAKLGGKVEAIYALLGKYDLVLIVDLPSVREAMKASIALSKATGISFSTAPAIAVAEFDRLVGQ